MAGFLAVWCVSCQPKALQEEVKHALGCLWGHEKEFIGDSVRSRCLSFGEGGEEGVEGGCVFDGVEHVPGCVWGGYLYAMLQSVLSFCPRGGSVDEGRWGCCKAGGEEGVDGILYACRV